MPTYVTLVEAARKYGISEEALTRLISDGMIAVETVSEGEVVMVADKNGNGGQTKEEIIAAKYGNLMGQPITLSDAAEKYDVPRGTIRDWFYNSYVTPTHPDSYPKLFDEAEIAYCAEIYHERKQLGTGFYRAPLLDHNGLPYKLKRPGLAEYRQKRNATKNTPD